MTKEIDRTAIFATSSGLVAGRLATRLKHQVDVAGKHRDDSAMTDYRAADLTFPRAIAVSLTAYGRDILRDKFYLVIRRVIDNVRNT